MPDAGCRISDTGYGIRDTGYAILFRVQLAFHKDIDFSEPIEYLGTLVPENEIKEFLTEKAIDLYN